MLCLAEKDLGISSETKGNDRALEDSLKEINAKLCKLDEKLDQTAQKIDQHTLKAFSNRKSDEERTTHLKINITRKNMSKFYVEQHESCLENL